jgi:ferric-dicitrate binding protein FerR (iron transport regulator)
MMQKLNGSRKLLLLFLCIVLLVAGVYWLKQADKDKAVQSAGPAYARSWEGKAGERSVIVLDDSTHVVLNSASVLHMVQHFNQPLRQVQLDGDAFFEVDARPGNPFVVTTNNLQTTVQAPSRFRIIAPKAEAGAQIDVLEGKLLVEKNYSSPNPESETLQKGEMILFNRDIDLMEKESSDTVQLQAWIAGQLHFAQTPFSTAVRQLEEWFSVNITVEGQAERAVPVTCHFQHPVLTQVLEQLCKQQQCRYTLRGNQVSLLF